MSAPMWRRSPARKLDRAVLRASRSAEPIVVGPWHSEIGFEVLYWIPFLHRLVERYELDPAQIVACSRGGVASWYGGIADRYVEVFDFVDLDEHTRSAEQRRRELGGQKQAVVTAYDEQLLAGVRAKLGVSRRSPVLHPALMFDIFRYFWKGGEALGTVLDHLRFRRFPLPDPHPAAPERPFGAVKFYFRESFPDEEHNRALVERAIDRIAARMPVVSLETGLRFDEHVEAAAGGGRAATLPRVRAAENLGVQSAVLAHAELFAGTYGGFAYIAAAYGVPAFTFAEDPQQFMPSHLDVARRAAAALDAPLTLLDPLGVDALAVLATTDGADR
jgi:hypothetical protein